MPPIRRKRKKRPGGESLFFAVLAAVTVLAWLLPLRPTVSEREKRRLEPFPTFSPAALTDGSYFEKLGLWFSDTFPGRDQWIGLSQSLQQLYGHSDIMIYGVSDVPDTLPAAPVQTPEASPALTSPASAGGRSPAAPETEGEPAPEKREPQTQNEPEEEIDWNGKVIEEEDLVTISSVIQVGDSAFAFPGFSQVYADRFIQNISRAAELLDGKCRVFNIMVFHATSLLLPRDFRESLGCALEEDLQTYFNERLDSRVCNVDTFTPLLRHNGEYIYFRSDHHWTALGAWYAYEEWAGEAGFEPVGLEQYEENVQEPFRGTLYYKANQSQKIRLDQVYTYTPPGDVHLYHQVNKDDWDDLGVERPLLFQINGNDKYAAFLGGDLPMSVLVNNDIRDGSACLLLKNSNGNPLSYYFTQHYQYTFVLDYRKYFTRTLTDFVDYYHVSDVIFCLSSDQAQSRGGNELLEQFIR